MNYIPTHDHCLPQVVAASLQPPSADEIMIAISRLAHGFRSLEQLIGNHQYPPSRDLQLPKAEFDLNVAATRTQPYISATWELLKEKAKAAIQKGDLITVVRLNERTLPLANELAKVKRWGMDGKPLVDKKLLDCALKNTAPQQAATLSSAAASCAGSFTSSRRGAGASATDSSKKICESGAAHPVVPKQVSIIRYFLFLPPHDPSWCWFHLHTIIPCVP